MECNLLYQSFLAMNFLHIKETSIYVKDLQLTEDFYCEKLGLTVIAKSEGHHVFFKAGKSVLLCFIASATEKSFMHVPPHGASGQIHFAFEVKSNEYESAKTEILGKNIPIEREQEWKKNVFSFYFRDPDGHLVEIAQEGIWD
jgi:catechol 2,3-dioxygenase-like lactoylglutathione lyase family enzyme